MPSHDPVFETAINWLIHPAPLDGEALPEIRLPFEVHFCTNLPGQEWFAQQCWLDTGAPLSVIPRYVYQTNDFAVHVLPLSKHAARKVQWLSGIPCDVGRVEVRLPIVGQTGQLTGPFFILAKLPQRDPKWTRGPVPVIIGLQFLLACRAELALLPPGATFPDTLPWKNTWQGSAGVLRTLHHA